MRIKKKIKLGGGDRHGNKEKGRQEDRKEGGKEEGSKEGCKEGRQEDCKAQIIDARFFEKTNPDGGLFFCEEKEGQFFSMMRNRSFPERSGKSEMCDFGKHFLPYDRREVPCSGLISSMRPWFVFSCIFC